MLIPSHLLTNTSVGRVEPEGGGMFLLGIFLLVSGGNECRGSTRGHFAHRHFRSCLGTFYAGMSRHRLYGRVVRIGGEMESKLVVYRVRIARRPPEFPDIGEFRSFSLSIYSAECRLNMAIRKLILSGLSLAFLSY